MLNEMSNEQFIKSVSIDRNKVPNDSYFMKIDAVKNLDYLNFEKPITFFVGENAGGKSTLLEAIAVAYGFNPEGGTRNYAFSTYDSHSRLCDAIKITKGYRKPKWGYFLRAESFYNVATAEMDYSETAAKISEGYHWQSHGESFLAVVQKNLQADSIYFFDEPETALSPQRQLTLLREIYKCAKNGSQFIIVSHSPILLAMPDAAIYSFDGGKIHSCAYEETESYQITQMFLENREQILGYLLDGD